MELRWLEVGRFSSEHGQAPVLHKAAGPRVYLAFPDADVEGLVVEAFDKVAEVGPEDLRSLTQTCSRSRDI